VRMRGSTARLSRSGLVIDTADDTRWLAVWRRFKALPMIPPA
jgi:hypothetical protein